MVEEAEIQYSEKGKRKHIFTHTNCLCESSPDNMAKYIVVTYYITPILHSSFAALHTEISSLHHVAIFKIFYFMLLYEQGQHKQTNASHIIYYNFCLAV